MNRKKIRKTSGITLIALVITIIVLLILAAISIITLTGENGILTQASRAKLETEIAKEKEYIKLGVNAVKTDKLSKGDNSKVKDYELQDELNISVGQNKTEVTGEGILTVIFIESQREYTVDTETGDITYNGTTEEIAKRQEITEIDLSYSNIFSINRQGIIKSLRTEKYGVNKNPELVDKNNFKYENYLTDLNLPKAKELFSLGFLGEDGKIYQWSTDSNKPVCINDIEGSILKEKKIKKVAIEGFNISAVLDEEGKVYTWKVTYDDDYNEIVELMSLSDVEGSSLKNRKVKDIYTNVYGNVSLAVDENNMLHAYGSNSDGELGNGTNNDIEIPICISERTQSALYGKQIKDVYSSDNYTLVLDKDGNLYGCGSNRNYKLGDGTNTNRNEFFCMNDISGSALNSKKIVTIGKGRVLDENGKVYSWGSYDGGVGNGTSKAIKKPICISDITDSSIFNKNIVKTSSYLNYLIDSQGKVYSWGKSYWDLGFETQTDQLLPVCISDISGNALNGREIVEIEVENSTVVAIDKDGKVYTWGDNLGNGVADYYHKSKVPICLSDDPQNTLYNVKAKKAYISEFGYCIAILDENNNVYTWGNNPGNGTKYESYMPVCITSQRNHLTTGKIVKTSNGRLALDENGKVYDLHGNIYNYPCLNSSDSGTILASKKIIDISSQDYRNAVIDENGKVYEWVDEYDQDINIVCVSNGTILQDKKMERISISEGHSVAIEETGKVYTWGNNEFGQLGDGTNNNSDLPICISDINNSILHNKKIVNVYAGTYHTIAIDEEGKVYTWGSNQYGELGNGTNTNSSMPICISDISGNELNGKNIIMISASNHNIVIDSEGKVYTWGLDEFGQLGNTNDVYSTNLPNCINNAKSNSLQNKKAIQVVANDTYTLILTEDREMYLCGGSPPPS